ncbi:MAG: L-histidine N(alpha)-methyltransferase [Bryobacteraceae bacterium]
MKIEVLLTETEICHEFSEALEARDIPEKFFYWSPLAVRSWLALSRDVAFESNRHSWNLLVSGIDTFAESLDARVAVVSLGAGDGAQDVMLLKALRETGRTTDYFPVDASQGLLEMACAAAEDAEVDALGIKADISSPFHLVLASDASDRPKIFVLSGNTLGAFDPVDQIGHLARLMREADRLVVDFEIHDAAAMTGRDGPVGRRFATGPLATVGVTREDGEVRFELKRDDRCSGLQVITRHMQVARDLKVRCPDREVLIQRGERVNLNFSYTYTSDAVRWLVEEHAGLRILEEIPSPDGRFVTAVCAK